MSKSLITLFLILSTSLCSQSYISKFGADILKRSKVVVQGVPKAANFRNMGSFANFKINKVYWGQIDVTQSINLFYPFSKDFRPEEELIVFLQPLNSRNGYRVIGEFSDKEENAIQKIKSVEQLLAIESMKDSALQQKSYLEYCLKGLKSEASWTKWNAFWEWKNIVNHHPDFLSFEMLEEVVSVYNEASLPSFKESLHRTIIQAKTYLSESQDVEETITNTNFDREARKLRNVLQTETTLSKKINALKQLSQYPCSTTTEVLLASIDNNSPHIRALAVFYLAIHGTSYCIPKIIRCLQNDTSLRVRKNAIQTLASLGAIEALEEIKKYTQIPYTKRSAERALQILAQQ